MRVQNIRKMPKPVPKIRTMPVITSAGNVRPNGPDPKVVKRLATNTPRIPFDKTSIPHIRLSVIEEPKKNVVAPPVKNQVNAEINNKRRPDRDPRMTCNPRLMRRTNEQPKEIVLVAESQQNRADDNLDINARLEKMFDAHEMLRIWEEEFMGGDDEKKDENGRR